MRLAKGARNLQRGLDVQSYTVQVQAEVAEAIRIENFRDTRYVNAFILII